MAQDSLFICNLNLNLNLTTLVEKQARSLRKERTTLADNLIVISNGMYNYFDGFSPFKITTVWPKITMLPLFQIL